MLQDMLVWIGFGLCHQLPERSLFGGGVQTPVCARDVGIYVGFLAGLALIAALHRPERPREFLAPAGWAVAGLFVLAMGVDGVSSYAGWRDTTNVLRLMTGLMAGYAAAAVIAPILNDELWAVSSRSRVLDPGWRLALWAMSVPVLFTIIWWGAPLVGVVYPVLVAACILGTLSLVNLVIVGMFPAFDRRAQRVTDLIVPLCVALGVAFVEIWLAGALRQALLAIVATL